MKKQSREQKVMTSSASTLLGEKYPETTFNLVQDFDLVGLKVYSTYVQFR